MGKSKNKPDPVSDRWPDIGTLRGKTAAPSPRRRPEPRGPLTEQELIELASDLAPDLQISDRREALAVIDADNRCDDSYTFPPNDVYERIIRFRQWIGMVKPGVGPTVVVDLDDIAAADKAMNEWRTPAALRRLGRGLA